MQSFLAILHFERERRTDREQERRKLGRGRLRNRAKHMRDKTQLSILHHLYLCGKTLPLLVYCERNICHNG